MKHGSAFLIAQFMNPSGEIVFRVSGWLDGGRIRKNLKTKAEAAAEKASLELKAEQATSGLRTVTTHLTNDQVREARRCLVTLKARPPH